MSVRSWISLLVFSFILVGCATQAPISRLSETTYPPVAVAVPTSADAYPAPGQATAIPTLVTYPEPAATSTLVPTIPPSGFEPQPGDELLHMDNVNLDLANSKVEVTFTQPYQADAILVGNLSDPCHKLRVLVSPADNDNIVVLSVYSLVSQGAICVTMIQPFTATIHLGTFDAGIYTVKVNDEILGKFTAGITP